MNPLCEHAKLICKNLQCGYKSKKNSSIWFCHLCRISEATNEEYKGDEIDILEKPDLHNVLSIKHNKENKQFEYGNDIFDILDIRADKETTLAFK